MKKIDYCIIGGGIAGTSAAETIRKMDNNASVAIICDEPHRLYSRVMLSKSHYVLGRSPKERVYLRPEEHYKESRISTLFGERVEGVDAKNKTLQLSNGTKIEYKKLLIATGGLAKPFKINKKNLNNVFPLQNLFHTHSVMQAMQDVKEIVVVGSGFISFEMASIFAEAGKKVTIIIRKEHFWQKILSKEASEIIEKDCEKVT